MRQGLMDDVGYHGFDRECEDSTCGHCDNEDCIWYDRYEEGAEE